MNSLSPTLLCRDGEHALNSRRSRVYALVPKCFYFTSELGNTGACQRHRAISVAVSLKFVEECRGLGLVTANTLAVSLASLSRKW